MGRFAFKLPDVGEGSAEAELVEWKVAPGDEVAEDQHIVDVMTEKATVEIPSPAAGKVLSITGAPGEMLAVGSTILLLEVAGPGNADADAEEPAPAAAPKVAAAPAPARDEAPKSAAPSAVPRGEGNYVFRLPDVGEGSAEAELVEWHVKPGDMIREDQHLVDVMTEKATVEIPAPASGAVVWTKGAPGEMLAVGSEILILKVPGAGNFAGEAQPAPSPEPAPQRKVEPQPAAPPPIKPAPANVGRPGLATRAPGEKPIASPAVRRRALEAGVALQFVAGSGPGGRIVQDDLDAYIQSAGAAPRGAPVGPEPQTATTDVKVIGLRRTIAARMQDAKRRIPHFSYIEEVDVTELEALRSALNGEFGKARAKLTLLPFLAKAMVRALPKWPQINARYHDDDGFVRRYAGVHLGVATQTSNGLVVPVVRHAETLTLWGCAAEISRLATAAREGKASRDELGGSTITITSLGALGGLATTPVINYPEVAIVGVNKMIERPVVRDGAIVVRKIMNLSSSFDHRVVDGWDAAEFVQRLRALLESPALLLAD